MAAIDRCKFLLIMGIIISLTGCMQTVKTDQVPEKATSTAPDVVKPPLPFIPGSWTLVILPDTQTYCSQFPGMYNLQTQWIADNKDNYY